MAITIDEYIKDFPREVQAILQKIRKIIAQEALGAQETISYGIPTFDLHGKHLVHFAAFAKHIGFYPTSSGIVAFRKEIAGYKNSAGTVQFQLDQPIPYELIKAIVRFRVQEVRNHTR